MRKNIQCPGCTTRMSAVTECDIEIDCCYACHGIWLDAGELQALFDAHDADDCFDQLTGTADMRHCHTNRQSNLCCPNCLDNMVETPFGHGSISVCGSCGGMFVESTTLDVLMPQPDSLISKLRPDARRENASLATTLFFALAGFVGGS